MSVFSTFLHLHNKKQSVPRNHDVRGLTPSDRILVACYTHRLYMKMDVVRCVGLHWSQFEAQSCGAIFSVWSQDLPNKECEVFPYTLWKHAPLPQAQVSLLGTPSSVHLG